MSLELIIAIVSALVAAIIVIFTIYYERQNLQFNTLLRFNQLLSNPENRSARRYVYNRWKDEFYDKKNDGLFKDPDFIEKAEIIATTFDEIGVFIYKKIDLKTKQKPFRFRGFLKKEFFFTVYSGAVVDSWNTLEEFIERERKQREAKYFMRYFEKLYDDAIEFRKKSGLEKTKYQKLNEKIKS